MPVQLTFIGNATVLLRYGPLTLLTDPNFLHAGQHAYLGYGLTTKRLKDPALTVSQLPPLSGIVLSHMHGDHWDRVARRELPRDVPIVTTPAAARALRRQGFPAGRGLATWETTTLSSGSASVTVTSVPGRHAFGVLGALLPPVMGSVLEFASGGEVELRLYLSGDTLLWDGLRPIADRFPQLDAGVIDLGGTRLPGGFLVTMDAAAGVGLVRMLQPTVVVPAHYDDYGAFTSGLADFESAAAAAGLADRVLTVGRGETVELG